MAFELQDDADQAVGWQTSGVLNLKWKGMLREYAPEYLEAWEEWMARTRERSELDTKTYELMIVAIHSVVGRPSPYIDGHIHKAFQAGATVRELVELVVSCGQVAGPHAIDHGLTALYKTIKDRESLGLPTPRNRPSRPGTA